MRTPPTLPVIAWSAVSLLVSAQQRPTSSLPGIDTHIVRSTHLNPSAETTVVLRKPDLREVGRFEGWPVFTIPPALVVFTRSMVHFAPAHPASLAVFDVTTGTEAPLYPAASKPYALEPSLTPSRMVFRDRLRPIYLAWEKASGPRVYGYDPVWFDISHTAFSYDPLADRLTFTETMKSNHPASVAPALRHQVTIVCEPMLKSSRACVERAASAKAAAGTLMNRAGKHAVRR